MLNTKLRIGAKNEFKKDFFWAHEEQDFWKDHGKY